MVNDFGVRSFFAEPRTISVRSNLSLKRFVSSSLLCGPCAFLKQLCCVALRAIPTLQVSRAALLHGSVRKFSSSVWQGQLCKAARSGGGDRLRRLRDSGFLAVDVVEDAELLPAIASVHV